MKVRALILLGVLGLFLVFMVLNWPTIMAPTTLNLGITEVNAPLGLVMLGMIALLTALFLIFIVYLQTSVLFEARRHAKELQTNRELADKAEASRFTELRQFMDAEIQKQAVIQAESKSDLLTKLDGLSVDIHHAIDVSGNSLSAYIGELEDRLESKFPAIK
ncbi:MULTISPECIES: LapA family protein [Methylotenera]|uniref:LapA family protein n=1 Tax=Methylotenera TaxID=359407 RepID=UPI00036EFA50|nr:MULTISPECIES: LapA family protein [Methylotenera]